MTREIKFRVWDKNKMINGDELVFKNTPMVTYDVVYYQLNKYFEKLNEIGWTVMQYTGLKDKNGKEIYEGDILQDGKKQNGQVLWAHNSWLIEWNERDYQGHRTYDKMIDDCFGYGEIIGNIYENPELLHPTDK